MTTSSGPGTRQRPTVGGHLLGVAVVVVLAVALVCVASALFEGNVILLVLPMTAVIAAAAVRATWTRKLAAGVAVVVLGAYTAQFAHWLFYDGLAPTDQESARTLVMRGVGAVVLAVTGVGLAHLSREPRRHKRTFGDCARFAAPARSSQQPALPVVRPADVHPDVRMASLEQLTQLPMSGSLQHWNCGCVDSY